MNYVQKEWMDAVQKALRKARRINDTVYIVYEDGAYHVADAYDLDTYFCGLEPKAAIEPTGEVYC